MRVDRDDLLIGRGVPSLSGCYDESMRPARRRRWPRRDEARSPARDPRATRHGAAAPASRADSSASSGWRRPAGRRPGSIGIALALLLADRHLPDRLADPEDAPPGLISEMQYSRRITRRTRRASRTGYLRHPWVVAIPTSGVRPTLSSARSHASDRPRRAVPAPAPRPPAGSASSPSCSWPASARSAPWPRSAATSISPRTSRARRSSRRSRSRSSRSSTTGPGKVELARFGESRRELVTFEQIPPILLDATTAVEDKTFWENAGFDPVAIVSAARRLAARQQPRRVDDHPAAGPQSPAR